MCSLLDKLATKYEKISRQGAGKQYKHSVINRAIDHVTAKVEGMCSCQWTALWTILLIIIEIYVCLLNGFVFYKDTFSCELRI